MEGEATKTTEIAVVTVPAFSHQSSILEFCKRLVLLHHHHFHVTCLIPTVGSPSPASTALVQSLPPSITCIFLPPVSLHDDHQNDAVDVDGLFLQDRLQLAVSRSMPAVRAAVESLRLGSGSGLGPGLGALLGEPLSIEALEIAEEMGVSGYLYFPCSAMMLSLCLYSGELDELGDWEEGIRIPGCVVRVSGKDLPDNLQDRSALAYSQFLQRCLLYRRAQGILVNSFTEMEAGAIQAWQAEEEGNVNSPSIYAIGPIIRTGSSTGGAAGSDPDPNDCLGWLEKQPPNSVLYVSFGSGGTLSHTQITELALGLELSQQRFLWVNVRPPSEKSSENYLNGENDRYKGEKNEPLQDFLPEGFLGRTKGRGLVMACWAPQVRVLGHSSIGGFLSHCGWNSVLESIVCGVPLIAWPLFAEQKTNAAMVVEGLRVGMRPRGMSGGIVEKEEIGRVIKCVMEDGEEGEGIRRRMKELRDAAACALMEDGSSTKTLSNLALKWRKLGGDN
ncbi:hydroquinone glucosyltransferase-like [Senna tora]|uniref:Glycosyltransferase n=1 Tax=Senna tora TaxID=362788 RepID=A0A834TMT9_9FABA|nr:hydroquinone glucosyltransferase-like [Senna tora]